MIKHILAATDGSDPAGKAVDLAAAVAAKFDAELTIIHVIVHGHQADEMRHLAEAEHIVKQAGPALPNISGITGTLGDVFTVERPRVETDRIVAAFGEIIVDRAIVRAKEAGARTVSGRTILGDYADAILKTADDTGVDMIFLGSRGLGGLRELLLGSVSHKVTQRAKCSVVNVR